MKFCNFTNFQTEIHLGISPLGFDLKDYRKTAKNCKIGIVQCTVHTCFCLMNAAGCWGKGICFEFYKELPEKRLWGIHLNEL